MVLLQIHWIMSETDILKTVTMNCGGGENVTLDWETNFDSCSNKSVFALSSNGLWFGNQIDLFNVFIYTFTVHPSWQRIFDFYEHAVVKKITSFIWVQPYGKMHIAQTEIHMRDWFCKYLANILLK